MKKFLIGLGVLAVVVIAAALVAPAFIDLNDYKQAIADRAGAATGRRIAIDGNISLSLLPTPTVSVGRVRVGNLPGGSTPDMVVLESARVRVAFMPLLRGVVDVQDVSLIRPVVTLEVLADGTPNWRFGAAPGPSQPRSPEAAPAAAKGDGVAGFEVAFQNVVVEDATVIYRDPGRGIEQRVEGLNARVSADSLSGPFRVAGDTRVRGVTFGFEAAIGPIGAGRPFRVNLNVTSERGGGSARFTGTASGEGGLSILGSTALDVAELPRFVRALGQAAALPLQSVAVPRMALEVRAGVSLSARDVAFNDIALKLGDTLATGAVSASFDAGTAIDATLKLNRLDLDALLARTTAPQGGGGGGAGDASDAAKGAPAASAAKPAATDAGFRIPADLTGSLSLDLGILQWRGGIVRQVQFDALVGDGRIDVKRLAALLPGGSDLTLSGAIAAVEGKPRFEGRAEAASDNLRSVLEWLGVDLGAVPTDRLRNFQMTATVAITPEVAQVYGIDLRVDTSRLTGGAAYAFRARPSFSVDFAIDRLNADAYLPAPREATAGGGTAAEPSASATPKAAGMPALAVLDDFDTNVRLRIGQLSFRQQSATDMALDASLIGGALTVKSLTVGDLAGAVLSLNGSAGDFAAAPRFALVLTAGTADPGRMARLAGVELPVPGDRLGQTDIRLGLTGTLARAKIDLDARFQPGRVQATGTLTPLLAPKAFDLGLTVEGDSLVRLAALFGVAVAPQDEPDTPVALKIAAKGTPGDMTLDLTGKVAGGEVSAAGTWRQTDGRPAYAFDISATHDDVTRLLRRLGVDFRPAVRNLGGFSLKATVAGEASAFRVAALELGFGPASLSGQGEVSFDGPRPQVTADLKAGELPLDAFLPTAKTGPKGRIYTGADARSGAAPPKERWSREPLDLSALRRVDAQVTIKADAIEARGYRFADADLAVALENGVLDVTRLKGLLFDGEADVTARLRADRVPRMRMRISLAGADAARALMQTAGIDAVTGRFDLRGTFAAEGVSQYDMIRNLGGKAKIEARDGVLRGIDLKAVSDRLGNLRSLPEFIALAGAATSQGETRYKSLTGTVVITDGVARSDDMVARMDAAEGTVAGVVDLAQWTIDATAGFRFTAHANAPPLAVRFRGSLDNPRKSVDTRAFERFLAARAAETILRKTLGKDRARQLLGTPQQPATQQQQAAPPVFGAPAPGTQPQTQPQTGPAPPPPADDPLQQLLNRGLEKLLKQ